jgi:hypothetical protein
MSVKIAVSHSHDPAVCARELKSDVAGIDPAFVIFFATPALDPSALGSALAREFGAVPSLGCTTAGEMTSGRMLQKSVVLLALGRDMIKHASVSVAESVAGDAGIRRAANELGAAVDSSMAQLHPERYVGLVLHDGLNAAEEHVMGQLAQLTNVPFVGGSAGDELKFERTTVLANFRPHVGTSAFALLEPARPYHIVKTQSFNVRSEVLTATEVDEAKRTVKRFDGRPAAREYCARLGIPLEQAAQYFRRNPVGVVMPDGEPFVRGLQRTSGEDIVFFCQILEGARVHLLEAGDMIERTRADLAAALERVATPRALINFDCVERRGELERIGQCEAYAKLFNDVPTIGFSTYGESYIGHINQTATMLLLG